MSPCTLFMARAGYFGVRLAMRFIRWRVVDPLCVYRVGRRRLLRTEEIIYPRMCVRVSEFYPRIGPPIGIHEIRADPIGKQLGYSRILASPRFLRMNFARLVIIAHQACPRQVFRICNLVYYNYSINKCDIASQRTIVCIKKSIVIAKKIYSFRAHIIGIICTKRPEIRR